MNKEISPKNLGTSIYQSYINEKKNRVEGMNRIIKNLKEVQSMKKCVTLIENEENEKKVNILLQQLKKRVDKIDPQLRLINQTVNYERHEISKRINATAFGQDKLNSTLDTLKEEVGSLKQQLLEKDLACESDIIYNHFYTKNYEPQIFNYSVYNWTIADVKKKVATGAFVLESEEFPLFSFEGKAKLQLYDNDPHIYMSLSFEDSYATYYPLKFTVIPQVTFMLLDVSKNKKQLEHRIRSSNYFTKVSFDYYEFNYKTSLSHKSWILEEDYNIYDTVEILILVESHPVSRKLYSRDGIFLQRVSNYKHKLLLEKKEHLLFQPSFYFSTHPKGYRVQVWMALDGFEDYKGIGLSARVVFLTDKFDSTLSSSFPHKTTVTLFNQRDLTNHLVKTFVGDIQEQKYYAIDMATHKQVEDDGYLLNDSLLYQVVIQPIEINQN